MSNKIIIDGIEYDVPIVELQRKADILDRYAERTEDGVLHREVLGTYHNYTLKFGVIRNSKLYNTLFDVLSSPVASHMVELPHDHITFEGYFSSVQDRILRVHINETAEFRELSCNLISTNPTRRA